MSDRPRFVFDANTIVSAALFKGSTPDRRFERRWHAVKFCYPASRWQSYRMYSHGQSLTVI
jgi:hypothetical protein